MEKTGFQDFVKDGSVNIVMFSDYKAMKEHPAEKMRSYFNDETCLKASCFDAGYISQKKAQAYRTTLSDDELVITADTIVILGQEVMGKPKDEAEARRMLRELSGQTHQVITGVTLTTTQRQMSFSVETDVTFKQLTDEEIDYYITTYHPLDKAGAYGIQEWIGHVGVTGMRGSYFNVMGLPVQRIYEALKAF